jgi:hypothetical protein
VVGIDPAWPVGCPFDSFTTLHMNSSPVNRKTNAGFAFLTGLGVGVLAYLFSESLIPRQVASPGDHDIFLANRLGFIYTPLVGLWLGWLQRSWRRAVFGAVIGIAIGFAYMALCANRDFLAIMVGFPCLLGAVLSAVVGSNRSHWLTGLGGRLGKGLLAGLILGFVYMVILNVGCAMTLGPISTQEDETRAYVRMMWRSGPIALGISSALFFVLIRWAVGLTRVKLVVFEDAEERKPDHEHTA